jgi:hypothetical protein
MELFLAVFLVVLLVYLLTRDDSGPGPPDRLMMP